MIEGPFGSEGDHHYTLILGDVEDFTAPLVCSSDSCDWEGLPSEAKANEVDKGDFEGWKRLHCPREGCRRGLKTITEAQSKQEKSRT